MARTRGAQDETYPQHVRTNLLIKDEGAAQARMNARCQEMCSSFEHTATPFVASTSRRASGKRAPRWLICPTAAGEAISAPCSLRAA